MVKDYTLEFLRERYKRTQTEKFKESEKERQKLTDLADPEDFQSEPPPPLPLTEKKQLTVKDTKKRLSLEITYEIWSNKNVLQKWLISKRKKNNLNP